jgi:hypothetical protein
MRTKFPKTRLALPDDTKEIESSQPSRWKLDTPSFLQWLMDAMKFFKTPVSLFHRRSGLSATQNASQTSQHLAACTTGHRR